MNLGELIDKLEDMRDVHGDIEVRFEHDLTLLTKHVENIDTMTFDDREMLVI